MGDTALFLRALIHHEDDICCNFPRTYRHDHRPPAEPNEPGGPRRGSTRGGPHQPRNGQRTWWERWRGWVLYTSGSILYFDHLFCKILLCTKFFSKKNKSRSTGFTHPLLRSTGTTGSTVLLVHN